MGGKVRCGLRRRALALAWLVLGCSGKAKDAGMLADPPVVVGEPTAEESVPEPPLISFPMPTPRPTETPPPEGSPLERACGACHGNGNCAGGICDITDFEALIDSGIIVPGDPNASPLYQRIVDGSMPPPGVSPRLADTEIQQLATYILRLKPREVLCDNPSLSWDQLYAALEGDIQSQPAESRPFVRYLSLSNRSNAGACAEELGEALGAMNKLINSLSQGPEVRKAQLVVDAANSSSLYRIDLRDYALDSSHGPFLVGGTSFPDGWQAMIANDVYAVEFAGPNASSVALQANTTVPVLFVDALIDAATVGDLYSGLLRQPNTRAELLVALGVAPDTGIAQRTAVLAATTQSELSPYDRVAVRAERQAPRSYYYEDFDLIAPATSGSVLGDPLAFIAGEKAGSEALFTLPNGLQAFALFDAAGERLVESPYLFDNLPNNNVMRTAISCMDCHTGGASPIRDEVRPYALLNEEEVSLTAQAAGFDFQAVLALYDGRFASSVALDNEIYASALSATGVSIAGPDPVSSVFLRFDEDVRMADVAGDLLYPVADLERDLPRLHPALSGLDDGITVDRDDMKGLYVQTLCIVLDGAQGQNRPTAAECAAAGTR